MRTGLASARSSLPASTSPSSCHRAGRTMKRTRRSPSENFRIIELPVRRPGDVNRHAYVDQNALTRVVRDVAPAVLDVHEEPFSVAARQWLASRAARPSRRDVHGPERRQALPASVRAVRGSRAPSASPPCTRAAVRRPPSRAARASPGLIEVLPLGYDDARLPSGRPVARRRRDRARPLRAPRAREGCRRTRSRSSRA